jgi:hypothetical protein
MDRQEYRKWWKMLTISKLSRRSACSLLKIASAMILSVAAVGLGPPSAQSADAAKCDPAWDGRTNKWIYPCSEGGNATKVGPAKAKTRGPALVRESGPKVKPSCELSGVWTFCIGPRACLYSAWSPPQPPPASPKPAGAGAWVRMCRTGLQSLGTIPKVTTVSLWRTPAQTAGTEPPLIVQARQAIATLRIPRVGLAFNPPGRTIVGIDTWWWATGTTARARHGTSAFGLVATATPTTVSIDPGDDTDPTTCPWTTTRTAAEHHCHTTYTTSSTTGPLSVRGRPAYRATITPTWQITFTNDGTPITFPDLDTTIDGPPTTTPVPVYEIQTIVTGTE